MTFDEMNAAINEADRTLQVANNHAEKLLRILVDRVRLCDNAHNLRKLKATLRSFDSRTGRWAS